MDHTAFIHSPLFIKSPGYKIKLFYATEGKVESWDQGHGVAKSLEEIPSFWEVACSLDYKAQTSRLCG